MTAAPGEYAEAGAIAVRPRDAATLIIVRQGSKQAEVLMGKRAATHKFMPNKFVFPGGRVDPADARVSTDARFHNDVARRLATDVPRACGPARQRAIAMAAIRETFEETGLVFGEATKTPQSSRNQAWQSYYQAGVRPAIDKLDFIARAITPTYRTRRFDTRFFLGYEEQLHSNPENIVSSGELLDIHWLTLKDARALEIPAITRQILDFIDARLALPANKRMAAPAPLIRFIGGKPAITELR